MSDETKANRLKRLYMRSWRRGTKEMDLILGGFADKGLSELTEDQVDAYESLIDEADHDLYGWITGQTEPPVRFAAMVGLICQAQNFA